MQRNAVEIPVDALAQIRILCWIGPRDDHIIHDLRALYGMKVFERVVPPPGGNGRGLSLGTGTRMVLFFPPFI